MTLILTLACLLAQHSVAAVEPDELGRLEGVWSFAAVEVDGARQPDAPPDTNHMIVGPRGAYLVIEGPRITRGQMRIDSTKSPRHLDVEVAGSGSTFESIYDARHLPGRRRRADDSFRRAGGAAPHEPRGLPQRRGMPC